MKRSVTLVLCLLMAILPSLLIAQQMLPRFRVFIEETNPTDFAISLYRPADARNITLEFFQVHCNADCVVALELGGTVPTVTEITPYGINGGTAQLEAYEGSNSTGGTVVDKFHFSADNQRAVDLSDISFPAGGAAHVLTLRPVNFTGTLQLSGYWRESN